MTNSSRRTLVSGLLVLILTMGAIACGVPQFRPAARPESSAPGTAAPTKPEPRYVALGSSYASGPGGARRTDTRCERTDNNYPSRVAAELSMRLVDVSCSGATTADILTRAQPRAADRPQIDAVTADTALVTVTIGGNNVDYIRRVMAQSCLSSVLVPLGYPCRQVPPLPTPEQFDALDQSLRTVAFEIRQRAPRATVLFVDYLPLARRGETGCAQLPLTAEQIHEAMTVVEEVSASIADAATAVGAHLVRASAAGRDHGVCSKQPWLYGFHGPAPYHERAAGKAALARLVVDALTTRK